MTRGLLYLLAFLATAQGGLGAPAPTPPSQVASGDFYRVFSTAKLRKLMSQLDATKAPGTFPQAVFVSKVWHDDKYSAYYILILPTHTLLKLSDSVFGLPEANAILAYGGSWDLRKDLTDDPAASSRLSLSTKDAAMLVFHCVVDGQDFAVP